MSLPSDFVIEDAVGSIGDLIIYRADHPIHGKVSVYLPDENLPPKLAGTVRSRLYQSGLRMRQISLLNLRFVAKALEVSQNPNEPYVITQHAKYSLEELIGNGVTIKTKRMFVVLAQVLEAIVSLAANGWAISRIQARQIKMPQVNTGDVSLAIIEDAEQSIGANEVEAVAACAPRDDGGTKTLPAERASDDTTLIETAPAAESSDRVQTLMEPAPTDITDRSADHSVVYRAGLPTADVEDAPMVVQRNIRALGSITYQLLFGRKYVPGDELALADVAGLSARWRRVLERALSEDADRSYDKYESMLRDVRRASNRNRRLAVGSVPLLLVLAVVAGYLGYERYRRHKIMTSEAGQAIKSFLDIVNESQEEFPALERPQPQSKPDEETILEPFSKIESVDPNQAIGPAGR